MQRKRSSRFRLTDKEHNALQKISTMLNVEWFSIAGSDAIVNDSGILENRSRCNGIYDEVFDVGTRRYLSLNYGVRLLDEAFDADVKANSQRLNEEELMVYLNLLKKLDISVGWKEEVYGRKVFD